MKNPHDRFFKESLSRTDMVTDFLENYLPDRLSGIIDIGNIRIQKDSFVDKKMNEFFSDVVYKVKCKGKNAYLCFLFEHKSYPDSDVSIQLLKYMVSLWELKIKQNEKKFLIIPLLIYHGKAKWNIGLKLIDCIEEFPDELNLFLPDFEYLLYDLSSYSKEEIKGYGIVRVLFEVLKSTYSDDFKYRLITAIEVLERLEKENKGIDYFEVVIRYVLDVKEDMNVVDIIDIVSQISSVKGGKVMTIADKLKQEGREEGREEGRKEGRKEELIKVILKVLVTKYGISPVKYKEKLKEKDLVELEIIFEKVLSMENISELDKYMK